MTQRHFVAIAQQIIHTREFWLTQFGASAYRAMISEMIDVCRENGARFDLGKFKSYLSKHGVDYDSLGKEGPCTDSN